MIKEHMLDIFSWILKPTERWGYLLRCRAGGFNINSEG